MSDQRPRLRPLWKNVFLLGNLQAPSPKAGEGAERGDNGIAKNMPIATLFRNVEPDAIPAQSLVGPNLARRIFERIAVIFESVSNDYSHQRPLTKVWLLLVDAFARHAAALIRILHMFGRAHNINQPHPCFFGDVQPARSTEWNCGTVAVRSSRTLF